MPSVSQLRQMSTRLPSSKRDGQESRLAVVLDGANRNADTAADLSIKKRGAGCGWGALPGGVLWRKWNKGAGRVVQHGAWKHLVVELKRDITTNPLTIFGCLAP